MTGALLRLLAGAFGRAGIELIPAWRMERLGLARHLHRVFRMLDIDLVLDVGANNGQYRDFLRSEAGFTGSIVSFEPIPELAQAMTARAAADPKWEVRGYALGDTDGEATFNVARGNQFSSFLTADHTHVAEFAANNAVSRAELVQVHRLDSVMPEIVTRYRPRGIYLKLDTQGYDLHVLRGGRESLRRVAALQSEVSVLPLYTGMPGFQESLQTFAAEGFDLSALFIVQHDRHLRAVEFDCVMLNRAMIGARVSGPSDRTSV